jgi:hypothetical protein
VPSAPAATPISAAPTATATPVSQIAMPTPTATAVTVVSLATPTATAVPPAPTATVITATPAPTATAVPPISEGGGGAIFGIFIGAIVAIGTGVAAVYFFLRRRVPKMQ